MSAPDSLSGKVRISSVNSASQLKNPRSLQVSEFTPQTPSVSKTSQYHRQRHFKEHQKSDQSPKLNIFSADVYERRSKDAIDNSYASPGKNIFSSFANYKNVVSGLKIEAMRPGEHHVEREWSSNYVSELHDAVTDLQDVSATINKRLDDTYYSILEKLSSLQSTIISLKDLASKTRQLNVRLVSECHKVSYDSNRQLDCFESFQDQVTRIKQLKKRVDLGRQRFLCLIDRVKHVKKRVEGWEIDERQWRKTSKKRMKIFWSFLVGILAFTLLLFLLSWWVTENADRKSETHPISSQFDGSQSNEEILMDTNSLLLKSKVGDPNELNIRWGGIGVMDKCQNSRDLNEL
ncbi:hypothetical protein OnM2_019104 [Erysiphe neolycopersici]|uniref:Uncharacterized protein n=1 Tax=Erysiphe neolycopersici TaxID=212602 RepID=A0A420I443_9PEZI|nr:hypothetical protein OnM2_019104 [Erysiphe neolycopersici]